MSTVVSSVNIRQEGDEVTAFEVKTHNTDSVPTTLEKIKGMYEKNNVQQNPYVGMTLEELRVLRKEKLTQVEVLWRRRDDFVYTGKIST